MHKEPIIIVFANEKGGSGKSTSAMHVAIALLYEGYKVASLDLDARQGTLTRYLANRFEYCSTAAKTLPMPFHIPLEKSGAGSKSEQEKQEKEIFTAALSELKNHGDFIVIDTQGAENYYALLAHAVADIIVTPLNDSFIDLDVLARIDSQTGAIKSPSIYTKIILQTRQFRPNLRWIVMRNRQSQLRSKNKNEMAYMLQKLSKEFGFELLAGFSERISFRELFSKGLTLIDLAGDKNYRLSLSELSGRQEVRHLLNHILNPEIYKNAAE